MNKRMNKRINIVMNIEEIKKIDDVSKLEEVYERFFLTYSFKPDREKFPHPKIGDVIDENKSVKWNREEVDRLRKAFETEVARRNKEYYFISNIFKEKFIELLASEYSIKVSEANIIWKHAFDRGHSCGIFEVTNIFREYANMYEELLSAKRKRSK